MATYRYTLLDVFTRTPLEGNGLAVVHGADALDEPTMLAFARETRLSETTFVQSSFLAGADYRNRIWTVERELPFACHPSLGTAVAVARADDVRDEARYVQETGAGLQPIDVRFGGGGGSSSSGDGAGRLAHASMLQEPATRGPEIPRPTVLHAIGLTPEHADPQLPPQIVSTGLPQLLVPLRDRDALARARPDYAAIAPLLAAHGAVTLYAVVCDPTKGAARARSFVSAAVGEDPATGSAAGPLCAYLAARTGAQSVSIDQGVEMGRPSRLEAAMEGDRPRVGGDVVVLVDGVVHL
jgi:trans-2,3-dihydro-3-hydroxyanthranilate isomerase